jgi:cbb3-type cytochrome oxidase subunit 1
MDRFVKNFIGMSIVYLFIASLFGIVMLARPSLLTLKFAHSHLNMLGWVSMMIYGVGYHILPRFTGKPLKSPKMGEVQFWLANIGLVGMLFFYTLGSFNPETGMYTGLTAAFGLMEAVSIFLFFYNMLATIYGKSEA